MVSFKYISTYRSALMGVAMLLVFCFHAVGEWAPSYIHDICSKGIIGVDIFIFLSAIGLSFSLEKNNNIFIFYKRRIKRIFPTYWFIMTCVYLFVSTLNKVGIMPNDYYRYPHNLWEIIQTYSTIGYWIKDGLYYLWYIPAITILYLFFPLIFRLFRKITWRKSCFTCLLPSLIIMYLPMQLTDAQWCLIYRIGIFMFGAIFYHFLKLNKELPTITYFLGIIGIIFYIIRGIYNWENFHYQIIEDAIFYIILPFILLSTTLLFKNHLIEKSLYFIGTISLEFYLVHEFILRLMETISNFIFSMSVPIQKIVGFILSLLIAYTIHIVMSIYIFRKKKNIK